MNISPTDISATNFSIGMILEPVHGMEIIKPALEHALQKIEGPQKEVIHRFITAYSTFIGTIEGSIISKKFALRSLRDTTLYEISRKVSCTYDAFIQDLDKPAFSPDTPEKMHNQGFLFNNVHRLLHKNSWGRLNLNAPNLTKVISIYRQFCTQNGLGGTDLKKWLGAIQETEEEEKILVKLKDECERIKNLYSIPPNSLSDDFLENLKERANFIEGKKTDSPNLQYLSLLIEADNYVAPIVLKADHLFAAFHLDECLRKCTESAE